MKTTRAPNILRSKSVGGVYLIGAATSISVYDPEVHSGAMAVSTGFISGRFDFKKFISRLNRAYADFSNLKVHVCGGAIDDGQQEPLRDWVKTMEKSRGEQEFLERSLAQYFQAENVNVKWLPYHQNGCVSLDLNDGGISHRIWGLRWV